MDFLHLIKASSTMHSIMGREQFKDNNEEQMLQYIEQLQNDLNNFKTFISV